MSLLNLLGLRPRVAAISTSSSSVTRAAGDGGTPSAPQEANIPGGAASPGPPTLPSQPLARHVAAPTGAKQPDPQALRDASGALEEAKAIAKDLAEEARGARPGRSFRQTRDTRRIKDRLREIANRSPSGQADPVAENAVKLLGQIEDRENELRALQIERDRNSTAAAKKRQQRLKKAFPDEPVPEPTGEPNSIGTTGSTDPGATAPKVSQYANEAKEIERQASAIIEQSAKIDAEASKLVKEAQVARAQFKNGKISPDKFLESVSAAEKQGTALDLRRQQLSKAAQAVQTQAESAIAKVASEMPTEVEAQFKTKVPKEIMRQGRTLPKGGVATGLLGIVGVIATAYFLVESIHYVMEADSVLDGVGRALEVGGRFAAGAGVQGVLSYLAGSAAAGFGLAVVAQMPNDHGVAYNRRLQETARAQALEEQQRKMERDERTAIGKFLEESSPGSVTWVKDHYQVNDQKLWDRTVAQVHELLAMQIAKDRAKLMQRARQLGASDGRNDDSMASKDDMHDWNEVKNAYDPMTAFLELFEEYKIGFKEGGAKRVVLQERATKLGSADARAGKPKSTEQIDRWPEVARLAQDGANLVRVYRDLYEAYETTYDAIAGTSR
jgi:hypothetical protein